MSTRLSPFGHLNLMRREMKRKLENRGNKGILLVNVMLTFLNDDGVETYEDDDSRTLGSFGLDVSLGMTST